MQHFGTYNKTIAYSGWFVFGFYYISITNCVIHFENTKKNITIDAFNSNSKQLLENHISHQQRQETRKICQRNGNENENDKIIWKLIDEPPFGTYQAQKKNSTKYGIWLNLQFKRAQSNKFVQLIWNVHIHTTQAAIERCWCVILFLLHWQLNNGWTNWTKLNRTELKNY